MGIGLAVALALLDVVVLRGERVAQESVSLSSDEPAFLEIHRPGEAHLLEIATRQRRSGETRGRSVEYRLEGPGGRVLAEESELVTRVKRFVRFTPDTAGEYRLYVSDPGLLGQRSGTARASVYVNDHRVLAHLFSF